jgi:PKD repeat protein/starvation-inducible outer membrane lipoprotein
MGTMGNPDGVAGSSTARRRRGRHIAVIATLVATSVVAVTLPEVGPASAGLSMATPMDESELPTYQFTDANALFVAVLSDIKGGTVCVVHAHVETPDDASCSSPAWGSPNYIVGIGTIIQPIEAPPLRVGSWRLLSENSLGEPTGLSETFIVTACPDCPRNIGQAAVARWKAIAERNQTGAHLYCNVQELAGAAKKAQGDTDAPNKLSWSWKQSGVTVVSVGISTGGVSVSVTDPFTFSQSKAKMILSELSCAVSTMYRDIVNDPPDPEYDTVVTPVVGTVEDLVDPETTALAESFARQRALGAASLTSFERYLGATDDGNDTARAMQAAAAADFTFELIDEIRTNAAALRDWATFTETHPELAGPLAADQAEIESIADVYDRITASGFTPEEVTQMTTAGLTGDEIAALATKFDFDLRDIDATDTLATISHRLADELLDSIPELDAFAREAGAVAARIASAETRTPPSVEAFESWRVSPGVTRLYTSSAVAHPADPLIVTIDFGDGTDPVVVTGVAVDGVMPIEVPHAYAEPGTYTTTISVTDNVGDVATASSTVTVAPITADAGSDQVTTEGTTVTISGPGTTAGDLATSVTVDPGDGSPPYTGPAPHHHLYRNQGTFTVTVTVVDDAAVPVVDTATVSVLNVAPTGQIVVGGQRVAGETMSFKSYTFDRGPDDVVDIEWSFGDGTTSTADTVDHVFAIPGVYEVTLSMDDGDGGTSTATRIITIAKSSIVGADSAGRQFWLMFPRNEFPGELKLFVTGATATTGTVTVAGLDVSMPFTVTPGQITTVELPLSAMAATDDEREPLGIEVEAGADVTVYGLNDGDASADAFLAFPADSLGTDYLALSYYMRTGSLLGLVATRNGTSITVEPPPGTPPIYGGPVQITLDAGESYQFSCAVWNWCVGPSPTCTTCLTINSDLTGAHISSNHPIAVFGAHACVNVPWLNMPCDHLVEQLPPTHAWGRKFITVPLATRSGGDTFRFLAAADNTSVLVDGVHVATLDAGRFHEKLLVDPSVVTASGPLLVAQYSNSSNFDRQESSDPFMSVVPPVEQYLSEYTVNTPASGFAVNYINVVAPAASVGRITLDGAVIDASLFTAIGATGFSGAQVPVGAGAHTLSDDAPFGVTVYGFDRYESYGYPGGFALGAVARVESITVNPSVRTATVGTEVCIVATVSDGDSGAVPGVRVDVVVTGAQPGGTFGFTDIDGRVTYCLHGSTSGTSAVTFSSGPSTATSTITFTSASSTTTTTTVPTTTTTTVPITTTTVPTTTTTTTVPTTTTTTTTTTVPVVEPAPPLRVAGGTAVPAKAVTEIGGRPNRTAVVSIGVTNTASRGYFQILACDEIPGAYSNVNAAEAGQTIANLALVRFGADGRACIYNHTTADIFVDVQGYLDPSAFATDSRRLLDTRTGNRPPLAAGKRVGFAGEPGGLAVISLIATDSIRRGYLQVLPCGRAPGEWSNLNVDRAGQTIANLAIVQLDHTGSACIYTHGGSHIVADLQGYLDPAAFTPEPRRLRDTRAPGAPPLAPRSRVSMVGRPHGLAITSLIATQTRQRGYVQALPCGVTPGGWSNLNSDRADQTIANLAVVRLDRTGSACLYTHGGAHLVADLQGYLDPGTFQPANQRILDTRNR